MMSYDSVCFDILDLEDWRRDFVYSEDKSTFLWIEHNITATIILNADATSAARFPPLPFAVAPKPPRQVGAPGVVKNPAPANFGNRAGQRRTDLDFMIPPGKTFDDVFGEENATGPLVD